ncbi:hypothetical protein A1Q2_08509 (mitochondrion) [Trichosporon asahii var. asahii CBS 8904]|uniref:Uncharacterized protein n=2 Tax=Trichosporon asahii var. asahii TaxID=189963 RepID=K1VK82_TRIAC|nr:hypothetical protein A1Q1_00002 [Trichosporon asahii var. asahii CBS 2479]EJT45000.1 hypothetical protein A1Q1_00002 [Trichosporon asahii var. asahii CBS 2479]EKC97172.1 hypothetical protein A1Q2_08509 [Trichosporon asahii var. asahii CBS 8904]
MILLNLLDFKNRIIMIIYINMYKYTYLYIYYIDILFI